jgi:hypothetical protein
MFTCFSLRFLDCGFCIKVAVDGGGDGFRALVFFFGEVDYFLGVALKD